MGETSVGFPGAPTDSELAAIQRIPAARAVVLVEGGYATLIDVRYRGSVEGGYIEGAVAVPLEEIETAPHLPRIEAIPASHLLIFY